ncbi:MAG TPA: hypothetical protein VHW74_16515 [Mycobacteriales bacterium]|nr:hypothetical protein [Mycobacteriales bacterium]
MTRFSVTSADGTSIAGWRNDGTGPPVLICNGLGTPPAAWPRLIAPENGFRVSSWTTAAPEAASARQIQTGSR